MGYALSLAALLVFVAAPVMGAIADKGGLRKRFLVFSCLAGSASTVLVSLAGPGDIYWTLGFFICAHVAFNAGNTFYDAFLPDIAPPRERDRISSLGYAYGYAGAACSWPWPSVWWRGTNGWELTSARPFSWAWLWQVRGGLVSP